ncbi:hypothetical protein [Methanoregula sp.]|jgi:hypothetical protein|uniref:hypothetical protein n=1 Tax=Methanoregula sp. TaxID=2052170 RepID=UPI0035658AD3
MPEATQAEIGRRLYHIQREKRVERAIKLIQQGLGTEWKSYTMEKIVLLGHLLQCTWNTIDQEIWEKIPFAHAKKSDIDQILSFGEGVRPGKNPTQEDIGKIRKILLGIS